MAKITVEIDTTKKTGEVKVDGKKMENVDHVYYSKESEYGSFMVEVVSKEQMNDLRKITRLVADEQGKLVSDENSVGRIDIARFLERKWK